jgi:hypothetical protein
MMALKYKIMARKRLLYIIIVLFIFKQYLLPLTLDCNSRSDCDFNTDKHVNSQLLILESFTIKTSRLHGSRQNKDTKVT